MINRLLIILALASAAWGTRTITDDCTQATVQAAVNAASAGDTIDMPAGTASWGKPNYVSISNKTITLRGASAYSADSTVIDDTAHYANDNVSLLISGTNSYTTRICYITFTGTSGYDNDQGFVHVTGYGWKKFRMDHCHFRKFATWAFNTSTWGLIDSCSFTNTDNNWGTGIVAYGNGADSWAEHITYGSDSALYIEDCTFSGVGTPRACCDSYYGARVVFRHNTSTNRHVITHEQTRSGLRASYLYEVYNNTMGGGTSSYWAIVMESGTALVFNNTITGSYKAMQLQDYKTIVGQYEGAADDTCDGGDPNDGNTHYDASHHTGSNTSDTLVCAGKSWPAMPSDSGFLYWHVYNVTSEAYGRITYTTATKIVASMISGTRQTWNTNDSFYITNGWPCRDQSGRGTNQTSMPNYQWNNTLNGDAANWEVNSPYAFQHPLMSDHLQLNRDYFNSEYTYTPYTYPHPLRGGSTTSSKKCTITIVR